MAKKISYNSITDLNENWSRDPRNGFPYSGQSVQEFIKRMFNAKGGDFYYDADTSKYLIFADADSRNTYLEDREEHADLLLGSFDAPANYTAEITMISSTDNTTLIGTTGCYIEFTFDIVNKSDASTGDSVIATFTFNNSGNKKVVTQIYNAGDTVHFLADPYLLEGRNTITITITGRTTLAATTVAVIWTVVDLQLSSNFNMTQPFSSTLSVPFELKGAGVKYMEWRIDGQQVEDSSSYTDSSVSRVKDLNISLLEDGKHSVELRAYIQSGLDKFYSHNLYFNFVKGSGSLTSVLLGLTLDEPYNGTISAIQYQDTEITIALYDSSERSLPVTIEEDGTVIQSLTLAHGDSEVFIYTPLSTGTHTLTFTVQGNVTTLTASVSESEIGISEATDGMILKLSAKGRSNNETHPDTWTYGSYSSTMTGFQWNSQSGWNDGELVMPSGTSVDVNISPLASDVRGTGITIDIDYETQQVENENATVIDLKNESSGAGLLLTASTASLSSSGGKSVDTKYRSGDRIHISFIINRLVGSDARYLYIVNNGILERAALYESGDVFNVQDTLRIAPVGCVVKLRTIRIYNRNLTVEEAFCNYAVDAPNMLEVINKNDIFDGMGRIDADKVNANIPIMIITGDMSAVFNATNKNAESRADVEYIDLQDPTKSFNGTDIKWKPQGTSSLGYPRKNLRMYTNGYPESKLYDYLGEQLADGLYAFKDKAQPVNCWTLKADYAESSGSHNTGVARMWNDLMYYTQINGQYLLRTEAQKTAILNGYDYDVRTTVDGFPIVVFWRETPTSELVCMGQYNFNNDKSTEKVFGFCDIPGFDDTDVQCFEFLDSANPIALFTDVSNFDNGWDAAWESRFPDTKTPNLAPLKRLATWINSCSTLEPIYENGVLKYANGQEKWNEEKEDYFDVPKLCAYYVYLMRYGAVDQTVKNAMITTEDGLHWYFINYDNDTIFGIDNDSDVLNAWNYTRDTLRSGSTYYYAGHESVLWNCFENDPDCMAMVKTVDNALYTTGLTYANMLKMFDNEQCDKWCERIYNDNGRYKYIDVNQERYLKMLQGSRKSYRHWWLEHRMDMYDALWGTGAFRSRVIQFKCEQTTESKVGKTFTVGSAIDTYFGYGFNNDVVETGVYIPTTTPHPFEFEQDFNIGSPVNVFNANNIATLDLSSLIDSLASIDLKNAVGNDGLSRLTTLILGDATHSNTSGNLPVLEGLAKMTNIEEIDIRGFQSLTSLDLSQAHKLHTLRAVRSGLTSFAPAPAVTLTEVSLPATLDSMVLDSANVTSITYTPTSTLRSVSLSNVSGVWDAKSFVNTWLGLLSDAHLAAAELTLVGINWTNMTTAQVLKLGSVGTNTLRGVVTIPSWSEGDYDALVEVFGTDVFYPSSSFYISTPEYTNISLSKTSLFAGETAQATAAFLPNLEGQIVVFELFYNNTQVIPIDGIATSNGLSLNINTGYITTQTDMATKSFAIRAKRTVGGAASYTNVVGINVIEATYPSGMSISGSSQLTTKDTYTYTKSYSGTYNTEEISAVWSLNDDSYASIVSQDASSCKIRYNTIPASQTSITLTCTASFPNSHIITGTKAITLNVVPITAFSIEGDAEIKGTGDYDYTFTLTPSTYNVGISLLSASLGTLQQWVATVSTIGTTGVRITVDTAGQSTETVNLTVYATLENGSLVSSSKSIKFEYIDPDAINLDLPSGLLWRRMNIGATAETDDGLYFAWGETTGYADAAARNAATGGTGGFDQTSYDAGPAASISADLTSSNDAAAVNLGGSWRMPTIGEFQELYDSNNTDSEWTAINGVSGYKFMKKNDHSVYVFFPASGYWLNKSLDGHGSYGLYWSRNIRSDSYSYYLNFNSEPVISITSLLRRFGYPVRAVQ